MAWLRFLTGLARDGRLAMRQLRRRPAHNAFIILSLTIGMSICLAVFSIVDAVVFGLRPGIADRHRLMHVRRGSSEGLSSAEVDIVAAALAGPARSIAAESNRPVAVQLPTGAATVQAAYVSPDYFAALGTTPIAGRLLSPADRDTTVAVISERLWREEFAFDRRIAGRAVRIGEAAATIVGVAPAGFAGLPIHDIGDTDRETDVWLPGERVGADARWWVSARLADGATGAELRARASAITAALRARSRSRRDGDPVMIFPAAMSWREADPRLLLVLGLYLFVPFSVLAIACVNVINLQLADAATRARELTVRLALGAGRGALVTLLAIEVVPLAAAAATAGWWCAGRFLRLAQPLFTVPLSPSHAALAFTASLVAGATIGGGLVPGWLAIRRLRSTGLAHPHDDELRHTRLRNALVVAQVTITTLVSSSARSESARSRLVRSACHLMATAR